VVAPAIIGSMDELPVEVFLETYPPNIQAAARALRRIVREVMPYSAEGVRIGWRVIGYAIPARHRPKLFALIGPEPRHVHLFFQYGAFLADPDHVLRGAHLKLRQVRYLTFTSIEDVQAFPREVMDRFLLDAAELAPMTREQRLSLAIGDRPEPHVRP
jgi:Domain of unknown function (DU1801)